MPPVPAQGPLEQALLRACDVVVASAVLLLLSPVLLVIAVAIKLDSPGPVIYRQLRVGIDRRRGRTDTSGGRRTRDVGGRPFMMYKFRTMHVNAEEQTGPVWATPEDERVTRVGRFLRRHRLDELPQFWNVLRGDMAVVGPRPERPSLLDHLRDEIEAYELRQKVPPGITGWAQVHRDADQTVDDVRSKLQYDLEYVTRRSVVFDLRIMARTLPVMLERDSVRSGGRLDEDGRAAGDPASTA